MIGHLQVDPGAEGDDLQGIMYRHYAVTSQKLFRARLFEGVNDVTVVGIFGSPATISPYPNLASRPQEAKGVDGDLSASSSYTDSLEAE